MEKGHNLGGQQRTYICQCGWGTKDSVRASDMKVKMHRKKCALVAGIQAPPPFDASTNGVNGLTYTRRGNLQYRPLVANLTTSGAEVISVCDTALKDALKMMEKK